MVFKQQFYLIQRINQGAYFGSDIRTNGREKCAVLMVQRRFKIVGVTIRQRNRYAVARRSCVLCLTIKHEKRSDKQSQHYAFYGLSLYQSKQFEIYAKNNVFQGQNTEGVFN